MHEIADWAIALLFFVDCRGNSSNAQRKRKGSFQQQQRHHRRLQRLEFHRLALMALPPSELGCDGDHCCENGGSDAADANLLLPAKRRDSFGETGTGIWTCFADMQKFEMN